MDLGVRAEDNTVVIRDVDALVRIGGEGVGPMNPGHQRLQGRIHRRSDPDAPSTCSQVPRAWVPSVITVMSSNAPVRLEPRPAPTLLDRHGAPGPGRVRISDHTVAAQAFHRDARALPAEYILLRVYGHPDGYRPSTRGSSERGHALPPEWDGLRKGQYEKRESRGAAIETTSPLPLGSTAGRLRGRCSWHEPDAHDNEDKHVRTDGLAEGACGGC